MDSQYWRREEIIVIALRENRGQPSVSKVQDSVLIVLQTVVLCIFVPHVFAFTPALWWQTPRSAPFLTSAVRLCVCVECVRLFHLLSCKWSPCLVPFVLSFSLLLLLWAWTCLVVLPLSPVVFVGWSHSTSFPPYRDSSQFLISES